MMMIRMMMMIMIVVVESFQPLPIISSLRGNYGKQYQQRHQLPLHRASVGVGVGCTYLRLQGESFSSSSSLSYSDDGNANDDGGGTIVTAAAAATAITTPTGKEEDEDEEPSPFFQSEFESNGSIPLSTNRPTGATTEAKTKVVTKAAREVTTATTAPQQQTATAPPRTMEKNIYGYNKLVIDTVYEIICWLYPVTGTPRDYARFYVLETVARVPYFAYLSVLHLRETFGERYDTMSAKMRTHYAEADNELHHLLIMESLGGNAFWFDRTVAQTMAFFYYWYVIIVYVWDEPTAYHLSELIEDHAYNTYHKYTQDYGDLLKTLPVPDIARKYYEVDNPYLFDLFCTVKSSSTSTSTQQRPDDTDEGTTHTKDNNDNNNDNNNDIKNNTARLQLQSRPQLQTLYDVFINIRDDENEHWKTLCNLVQYNDMNAVDALDVHSTTPTLIATSTSTTSTSTSTSGVASTDSTTLSAPAAATTTTPPSSDTVDS